MTDFQLNTANVTQLVAHLTVNAKLGQTTLIMGPAGVGKTQLVYQAAEHLGYTVRVFMGSEMLPEDAGGIVTADMAKKEAVRLMPDMVATINAAHEETGKPVLAFLDEINNASMAVMSTMFKMVNEGVAGGYAVPDDTVFVCAGNPPEVSSAAQELPAPLLNRMAVVNFEGPTIDEWEEYALGAGVAPAVMGFLKQNPQYLIGKADFDEGTPTPTPRSWESVSNMLQLLDSGDAGDMGVEVRAGAMRMSMIASRVGSESSHAMEAYLQWGDKLVSWDTIKADPANAPVTDEFVPAYMQAVALVTHATTEEDAKAAITYARRLPAEVLPVFAIGFSKAAPRHKISLNNVLTKDDMKAIQGRTSLGRGLRMT